jgi:murein DD-endopeptidase MepM/ murein hydrolase activator NlpD
MTDPASPPIPMPAFITSPAGYRRSGRTGQRTWHEGADLRAPTGTPVLAVRPGRVYAIFRDEDRRSRTRGYGNLVVLYHPREAVYTAYAHLSQILVAPELEVAAGTVLGASGATSNGRFPRMPPHLHFAIRRPRRTGAAPWPGPYPNPDRNPALHREVWVDPATFLARFGIETTGRRPGVGALRIRPGSHADAGLGWPAAPRLAIVPRAHRRRRRRVR